MTKTGHVYTPKETVDFEKKVALVARAAGCRNGESRRPIHFQLKAWAKNPAMDLDNLVKSCADALNKIAYHDDRQIIHFDPWKFTVAKGQGQGVLIAVWEVA